MKQLFLFEQSSDEQSPSALPLDAISWKLFVDGASRNNPGKSGAGIYLMKDDLPFEQHGFYLGTKTNNQAEYLALLIGIFYLKHHVRGNDSVQILSDSQLLVRQLTGHYQVKHPELKPLHAFAHRMLKTFKYDIAHIMREDNSNADAMANKGVDEKIPVPADIKQWLQSHDIVI